MIENESIVCFAPNDWWGMNPSCATHIMKRLARQNRVLFINPFSSDLSVGLKKGLGARIKRKAKSIFKFLRKADDGLYVFSPVFLPFHGSRIIDFANNLLLKVQIRYVCRRIGIERPILWMENPRAADLMDFFNAKLVVYHVSDLFTDCKYTANKDALIKRERQVSAKSDLVICVSKALYAAKCNSHRNIHYLPHGVDAEIFHEAARNSRILPEIAHIPKPIAGYFGTMSASNDIELLMYCAKKMPHISFVFAGQITGGDYSELLTMPNVFYLGKLPYEKIPQLCAAFDVCLLQWKLRDWIKSCNPLKLFEYMASGRPIVSVAIDEVADNYSEIASVAKDKEEFCKLIEWELKNDTPQRSKARIDIAMRHNWDEHVEIISRLINETIGNRKEF
jgi:glycosyltransferase involved in cell wall biosynthesis